MKAACSWLGCALVVGFAVFTGCAGTSESGSGSTAGKSSGGSGGTAGNAGSQGGGVSPDAGQPNSGGTSTAEECSVDQCGPQLGLPNWTCEDGTMGGPTGRCLKTGDGCGWEVLDCPLGGEGGAKSEGGSGNGAGAPAAGGAASDPCGGCDVPDQICVYQLGGPGPSHFTCAHQNPCGAAGACVCIVGQGMCQAKLMGDPPSYCTCDNGLE
jgi:hypothetical protein